MSGVNCQLIGDDLNLIVSTMCAKFFTSFYILRMVTGMIAFGMLFSICCITCTNVRNYKHSLMRQSGSEIMPENSSGVKGRDTTMIKLEPV